jgi:KipI family sensor histidine kinase inhibitor
VDPDGLAGQIADWPATGRQPRPGPLVELPVRYDGPDLDDVARAWGCTREDAARRHAGVEYVVAFCGFAPGFGYCRGLPEELAVSRLPTPRTRVPAGSVAVAGSWTAVYPTASPGGWRLLGSVPPDVVARLWDPASDRPALLAPGTRVRFVAG